MRRHLYNYLANVLTFFHKSEGILYLRRLKNCCRLHWLDESKSQEIHAL